MQWQIGSGPNKMHLLPYTYNWRKRGQFCFYFNGHILRLYFFILRTLSFSSIVGSFCVAKGEGPRLLWLADEQLVPLDRNAVPHLVGFRTRQVRQCSTTPHVDHTDGQTSRRFYTLNASTGNRTSIKPHCSYYLPGRTGCIPRIFLLGSLIIMATKIHVTTASKMQTSFHIR